jgi:hypothetical protein
MNYFLRRSEGFFFFCRIIYNISTRSAKLTKAQEVQYKWKRTAKEQQNRGTKERGITLSYSHKNSQN